MIIENVTKKCAVCGEESEQFEWISSNNFGARVQLDLREISRMSISTSYILQMCPHCGYSNYNISKNIGIEKKDLDLPEFQEILNSSLNDSQKKFVLGAMFKDKIGNAKDAGRLFHCASWAFEDARDLQNAKKYRLLAVERIIKTNLGGENVEPFIQCVDLLRKSEAFEKAKVILEKIETKDKKLLKILKFENKLIKKKDSKIHYVDEVLK